MSKCEVRISHSGPCCPSCEKSFIVSYMMDGEHYSLTCPHCDEKVVTKRETVVTYYTSLGCGFPIEE